MCSSRISQTSGMFLVYTYTSVFVLHYFLGDLFLTFTLTLVNDFELEM